MKYETKVRFSAVFLLLLTLAVRYAVMEESQHDPIALIGVFHLLFLYALIPDKREDVPEKLKKLKYPNLFLVAIGDLTASGLVQTPWNNFLLWGLTIYTLVVMFLFAKNKIWL